MNEKLYLKQKKIKHRCEKFSEYQNISIMNQNMTKALNLELVNFFLKNPPR